jgi:hypothetical protein
MSWSSPRRAPSRSITAPWSPLDVDGELLEGLARDAVDHLDHDPRAGDRELIALAAHVLDQDREVQLAAPGDQELVRIVGRLHRRATLWMSSRASRSRDLAAGEELPVAPRERGVVDLEVMLTVGSSTVSAAAPRRSRRVAQGVGDAQVVDAGDRDDVPALASGTSRARARERSTCSTRPARRSPPVDQRDRPLFRCAPCPARCARCRSRRRSSSSRASSPAAAGDRSGRPGRGHVDDDGLEQGGHVVPGPSSTCARRSRCRAEAYTGTALGGRRGYRRSRPWAAWMPPSSLQGCIHGESRTTIPPATLPPGSHRYSPRLCRSPAVRYASSSAVEARPRARLRWGNRPKRSINA